MALPNRPPATSKPTSKVDNDYIDPPEPQKKSIHLIFSLTGDGKSTYGLKYAPGPIRYHDVDNRGFNACKEALSEGKVIKYLDLDYPRHIGDMDEKEAMAAAKTVIDKHWRNLESSVRESDKGNVRTIVWDTASELADIVNIMFTGRPERRNDDYGASSNMIKVELVKMVKAVRNEGQANLVMLAHAKEVWEKSGTTSSGKEKRAATGKYTFRGPAELASSADWAGHLRLAATSVRARASEKSKKHEIEITKAGIILSTLGDVYTEDQWGDPKDGGYGPFAFVCSMQHLDSVAEDWME